MTTNDTRAAFEAWTGYSEEALSRDAGDGYCIKGVDNEWRAWQAALASPEVQALRKDAERYKELRTGQKFSVLNWIGDELRGDALDEAADRAQASRAIDAAMEKQNHD